MPATVMFVHVHRLNKPLLVLLFIFGLPLGIWYLSEATNAWRDISSPEVEGMVLSKGEYRRFGGIPAGRLTIQLAGTDVVVTALVNKSALERFGNRVRFHYTGDPTREVFLEGEEDPIWAFGVGLFLLIGPLLLLVLYYKLRGRPNFEHIIE